jgi:hypothetical protein
MRDREMDGWEAVDRERAAAYARGLDMACFYVRCEVFHMCFSANLPFAELNESVFVCFEMWTITLRP